MLTVVIYQSGNNYYQWNLNSSLGTRIDASNFGYRTKGEVKSEIRIYLEKHSVKNYNLIDKTDESK